MAVGTFLSAVLNVHTRMARAGVHPLTSLQQTTEVTVHTERKPMNRMHTMQPG